jgi:hypothetical protein
MPESDGRLRKLLGYFVRNSTELDSNSVESDPTRPSQFLTRSSQTDCGVLLQYSCHNFSGPRGIINAEITFVPPFYALCIYRSNFRVLIIFFTLLAYLSSIQYLDFIILFLSLKL